MAMMPKKIKFRKVQRGTRAGRSKGARELAFGEYGLQALEGVWMTAAQIEAVRVTISRRLKKVGKLFIRVFPDKPITKKPAETRMGKGKGNVEVWVSVVKRDRIICELGELDGPTAKLILKQAAYKLPIKTRIVSRQVTQANVESTVESSAVEGAV